MSDTLKVLFWISLLLAWSGYQLMRGQQRLRAITSLPLSRIRAAAQGYVELQGRVRPESEQWLVSPLMGRRCVYYRLIIDRGGRGNERRSTETQQLPEFRLRDPTGECVVETEGANFEHLDWSPTRYGYSDDPGQAGPRRWLGVLQRYSFREQILGIDEDAYILGEFYAPTGPDRAELMRHALRELKQDQSALIARYDQNGDGIISAEEWELARHDTEREVSASLLANASAVDTTPRIRKPSHRHQPFIIAGELNEQRMAWWLRVQIVLAALGCLAAIGLLLRLAAH